LLAEQLSTEELINLIPDLATLIEDFGLDYGMAFQVLRARLKVQIAREDNDKLTLLRERLKAQKEASSNNLNTNGGTLTPPLSPTPLTPPLAVITLPDGSKADTDMDGAQPNGESVPGPKMVSSG
jgi:THO complex subunit 2